MKLIYLVFVVAFVGSVSAYNATLYTDEEAIEDQYIVVLQPEYDVEALKKLIFTDVSGVFSDTVIKWTYTRALNGFSARLSPKALEKVRAMKAVKYVAQDGVVRKQAVASWGLDRIDQRNLPLDGTASFTGDGSGVNAYIIDTGIYPESLYYEGRAAVAFDFATNRGPYGMDCNGHGSHCAGTIGSKPYGVAPGVKLFGVRVLNCFGFGTTSDIVKGCDYVATSAIRPAIASMSLGGGRNQALDDAVRGIITAGVTVAVAAGNSDKDACRFSPARTEEAITVGATDVGDDRASFSNFGSCVDVFAPGVDIPSVWTKGPEDTKTLSGTSMACPHVAGAAAIALGNSPSMTPQEVKSKILYDATPQVVKDPGEGSPNRLLYVP